MTGTSMAAPHVAGVAAKVWSHFPECTNVQIRNALNRAARLTSYQDSCDMYYGHGIVDAEASYELLRVEGCSAGGRPDKKANGGCRENPDYTDAPSSEPSSSKTPSQAPTE